MTDSPASSTKSATPSGKAPAAELHQRVEEVIERIRPAVQSDGGDIELVRITDKNVALVRLHGACVGCPSSNMTLQMGVERTVREKVPEITGVEQIE